MSDAEATIRKSILYGMAERNTKHEINTEEEAVSAVMECVFAEPVRWAVIVYLRELYLKELAIIEERIKAHRAEELKA